MSSYPDINKILTIQDVDYGDREGFVADPFVVMSDNEYHLFFEVFYRNPREKVVGSAKMVNNGGSEWKYEGIAIKREGLEYSFPYTFQYNSEWYMLPAIANIDGTRPPLTLYRAVDFPLKWTVESKFNVKGTDPVVFQWNDDWYLICNNDSATKLYFSDDLVSNDWKEHPTQSLSSNSGLSRMGGRPVDMNGSLYLMYQDGKYHYGEKVRCCRVKELDREIFRQSEISNSPIVGGQYNQGWNHLGMHHVDFNLSSEFAIVDGHDQDGWSIGMANCNCDSTPSRLTPSPSEFDISQSIRRNHQLLLDRIGILREANDYRKNHGAKSMLYKGLEKLIP